MTNPAIDLAPFLTLDRVTVFDRQPTKHALLEYLVDAVLRAGTVSDPAAFRQAIHDRETVTSTSIGGHIAIPHARLTTVSQFAMAMAIIPQGIDGAARDGKPVHAVVMIAAPEDDHSRYLQVLAMVASRLSQPARRDELITAQDPTSALDIFLR